MRRTALWAGLLWLAIAVAVADRAPPVRADDALASIATDASGDATLHLAKVRASVARGAWEDAVDGLAALLEDPVALLPVAGPGEGDAALRLPSREVAERLAARLPDAARSRLAARYAPEARGLEERALAGDDRAYEALATRLAVTAQGRRALRVLAGRDHEAGRFDAAARRLHRALAAAPADEVPAIVVRLAGARAALGDVAGVEALFPVAAPHAAAPVTVGGVATTLPRALVAALRRARETALAARAAAPAPLDPPRNAPVLLWRRDLRPGGVDDPEPAARPEEPTVLAGVLARPDVLVLHDGVAVRALDPWTGLVRWTFPSRPSAPWEQGWFEVYESHDVPLHAVTPAGDLVLAALGHPGASGGIPAPGRPGSASLLGREMRMRLVALDAATGELAWTTGTPDAAHVVLGAPDVGCASPPLVVGDDVFTTFARRRGSSEVWLACLARRDGAVRWVSFLAAGEGGRSPRVADGMRFAAAHAHAVPWGARPTLAGDELCVVPHAGFVAGVGARDGAVRWIRALPVFGAGYPPHAVAGPSGRNAPEPVPGAFVLAPMDSPAVTVVERGTGRLRATVSARGDAFDRVRDLFPARIGPRGTPLLRLGGQESLASLDLAAGEPRWTRSEAFDDFQTRSGGRALDLGAQAVATVGGALVARAWPGVEDRSWSFPVWANDGFEVDGDVHRAGDVWVVAGADKAVWAFADPELALRELAARSGDPAAASLRAALARDAAALSRAIEDAVAGPSTDAARVAGENALRLLEGSDGAEAPPLATALVRLPTGVRGPACARAADLLLARRDPGLVGLLDAWVAAGADGRVSSGAGEVREDLHAARRLADVRRAPWAVPALARREAEHARRLAQAATADDAALAEAVRRAVGTRAARAASAAWAARLAGAGRFEDAAALAADLRLDLVAFDGDVAARRREAAAWALREASWLGRAGEIGRARALATDLVRWAPPDLRDDRGLDAGALAAALRREGAWRPASARGFDVDAWPDRPPGSRAERGGVTWLGLVGPGASRPTDTVLLARGLALESWSVADRARRAQLATGDAGWLGVWFREVEPWVPGAGLLVEGVGAGQPADAAHIHAGDWITAWEGAPVFGTAELVRRIAGTSPGTPASLLAHRAGVPLPLSVRVGARPVEENVPLARTRAHAAADGRVVVATRVGLRELDATAGSSRETWRWEGTGTVRSVVTTGARAYVVVVRSFAPDTVVAVDLADGRELWRRDVPGTVERVWADGSAVVVDAAVPDRTLVLDRSDGSVRLAAARWDRLVDSYRTALPARSSATCAGRLWMLTGSGMREVNTTTAESEWAYVAPGDEAPPTSVAADAIVVAICADGDLVRIVPSLLGGEPERRVVVDTRRAALAETDHWGPVGADARVLVAGDLIYLLRVTGTASNDRNVNVWVMAPNDDVRPPTGSERPLGDPVLTGASIKMVSGDSKRTPRLVDAEATPEGILVTACYEERGDEDGAVRREVVWLSADPAAEEWTFGVVEKASKAWTFDETEASVPHRPGPSRVGRWLVLPTDAGCRVVPVIVPP